jgi:hypothetical protein
MSNELDLSSRDRAGEPQEGAEVLSNGHAEDRIDPRRLFSILPPVSLDAMNERAALQRRTDHKYLLPVDALARYVEELADDHEVLEIDGERVFEYESTYFDTPSLRCFRDHVRDRRPRYKLRTRCYVTTDECHFEVKVKRDDGDTVKRSVEYDPDERGRVEPGARDLIAAVLPECGLEVPDEHLVPSLITSFQRVTVAARERAERTTFDFAVTMRVPEGDLAQLEPQYAIAETKTPDGNGAWDSALAAAGFEPISLSKYRLGTGLLRAPHDDPGYACQAKNLLQVRGGSR